MAREALGSSDFAALGLRGGRRPSWRQCAGRSLGAVLGLPLPSRFSCCGARALGWEASEAVARGPQRWLGTCGAWAELLCGTWALPRPGIEPASLALQT